MNMRHHTTLQEFDQPECNMEATKIKCLPGDGTEVILDVIYIAQGRPIGKGGNCAFCHGDPCNEDGRDDSNIGRYFKNAPWATTCPVCNGEA